MAKQLQPFSFLLILVLTLLSGRTLQAIPPSPAPAPYNYFVRGSSPSPAPAPHRYFAPGSSPTPQPAPLPPAPIPPPVVPSAPTGGGVLPSKNSGGGSSGLSGGQKAGIAIGVLAGAGLIGFAAVVYMKRRSNIQRARFGASARRSQL